MKSTGADRGIALFDTELGRCGVAWGERGLRGVALPGGRDDRIRARLRRASPGAADAVAPVAVLEVIDGIVDLLAGAPADLSAVEVDLAGIPQLDRRVAAVARTVGPGETITYGEIAARLGIRDPREVGAALARNRLPIVIPCHRVVAANGGLGGFSAPGGRRTKLRMLEIERRHAAGPPTLFDA